MSNSLNTPYQSVAHVATALTENIYNFQTAFSEPSEFSKAFKQEKTTIIKNGTDGLARVAELISKSAGLSTVTISLNELFNNISYIQRLVNASVVIHVDTSSVYNSLPDYGKIAALRHLGFAFFQSFGAADAQSLSISAYLTAKKLNQPVFHFFYPADSISVAATPATEIKSHLEKFTAEEEKEDEKTKEEEKDEEKEQPKPTFSEYQNEILTVKPFEYIGSSSATSAIVLFASSFEAFVQAISQASKSDAYYNTGLVLIHLYQPWHSLDLLQVLPSSVKKLALVEQLSKRTTAWSPLIQDFVSDLQAHLPTLSKDIQIPQLTSFQLGAVSLDNVRSTLKAISANLSSPTPINNLFVGETPATTSAAETSAKATEAAVKLEEAYTKVLNQVFGDKLETLNSLDKPTTGFENSPEFGYGAYIAKYERKSKLIQQVQKAIESNDFSNNQAELVELLSQWVLDSKSFTSVQKKKSVDASKLISLLESNSDSSSAASILEEKTLIPAKSSWIIGSDAWSYDLGNSGIHHVLSSGKNVNMLVIDSQPYSEVVANTASLRKKDVGLYAMNFGSVYVASVAVYASYTQLLQAILEAESFDGPSIVLAYLPYSAETDSPVTVLQETKKAVDSGYWPLYRWNPNLEQDSFKLDSTRIRQQLKEFLDRENHLTLLSQRNPTFAKSLSESYGTEVRNQQKHKAKEALSKLLEGLSGPPLTVLFASDGGNAENLAKRLARRAKGRGLKSVVMSMDDYPVEELGNEENLVLVVSTAGQGELPQNGRNFWEAIKGSTDIDLAQVKYSVFGLGDSAYWPRKEDKHYYNKPSNDLFNKLKLFGASELAPLGQGDDQAPDGYQQGYAEWEPLLWTALGVDNVAAADEPPPITNEDIKINSDFLRGTIAEGLRDESTGAISASDQQLTKFHGIYMQDDRDIRDERKAAGLEPAYSFMIRARLPGCVATPEQWIQFDKLSTKYGNDTMKITTRGTFQFHGVIKRLLKPTIRGMNAALLDTVAACGDVNRTVVAAALPNNKKIHDEVLKISHEISEYLLPKTTAYHEIWLEGADDLDDQDNYQEIFANRKEGPSKKKVLVSNNTLVDHEPMYGPTYLPRKFKINIAVPPYNDVDVFGHDIGLVAIVEDNELIGFNVFVGGGMGTTHNNKKTYPRTGSLQGFITKDKIVDVCEKVITVQRDYGDRKNRKHARLKYTVDDMGNDVFRSHVEERLGYKFEPARPFHFDSNTDQFGWVTDETGLHHFTTFVENGRVENTPELQFKTGLRELAELMVGTGAEFRLTANQHILVSNVSDELLPTVKEVMAKYKLDNTAFSGLRLSSAACVAFPTCGLAMAESERYLPVLITKLEEALEEYGLRHDSIVMRMTGCPNGCARPWLAEIACVGKALGTYNLMLGGGHTGERLNKLYRSSIKEEEILDILKPMFKRWSLERNDNEPFGDWVIRAGIIAATREGKDFWDNIPEEE